MTDQTVTPTNTDQPTAPKLTLPKGHVANGAIPLITSAVESAFAAWTEAQTATDLYRNGEEELAKIKETRLSDNADNPAVEEITTMISEIKAALAKAEDQLEATLDSIAPLPEINLDKDTVNVKVEESNEALANLTKLMSGIQGFLPNGTTMADYLDPGTAIKLNSVSDKVRKVGDRKAPTGGSKSSGNGTGKSGPRPKFSVMTFNGTDLRRPSKVYGKMYGTLTFLKEHLKETRNVDLSVPELTEALLKLFGITEWAELTSPVTIEYEGNKLTMQAQPKE